MERHLLLLRLNATRCLRMGHYFVRAINEEKVGAWAVKSDLD